MKHSSKTGILWLKLSANSQKLLKVTYPPRYKDEYYDHVTLLFDVAEEDAKKYVNRNEHVEVYAHCFNERIEAVRVKSHLPDTYGVPHITLSTQHGVDPFESVAMLRDDHTEITRKTPLVITGTIEFIPLNQ